MCPEALRSCKEFSGEYQRGRRLERGYLLEGYQYHVFRCSFGIQARRWSKDRGSSRGYNFFWTEQTYEPALQVTTPFHRSSSLKCAMKLYAPRILKLNTSWRSSRFNQISLPIFALKLTASTRGVSFTNSYTLELRISRR